MSYQAAERQQQNSTATRAERGAMQPFATAIAAAMPRIALKTDQLLGLFLLIVVVVINILLLSSGSGGG